MHNEELFELVNKYNDLLNIIRCDSNIEKTVMAKYLNISFPTLIKQIDLLVEGGILLNATSLEINNDAFYSIGISIGGAQCKVTIIDAAFKVLSRQKFENICNKYNVFKQDFFETLDKKSDRYIYGYSYFNTPTSLLELNLYINSIIEDILELQHLHEKNNSCPPILSIGIVSTGSVDAEKQTIIRSNNVDYLKSITKEVLIAPNILEELRKQSIPLIIDHNAKAMIVCEKFALYDKQNINNNFQNKQNIVSLYLGSGIGCGIILDNQLMRGCRNLNGELGHIQVPRYPGLDKNLDAVCSCGSKGCLEYYIISDVFEKTRKEFNSMKSQDIKDYFYTLSEEAKSEKMKILGYYIGWTIDAITKFLNIGLIVFSGKLMGFIDQIWQYSSSYISGANIAKEDCAAISSSFGSLSPTIGAAILSTYPVNEKIKWLI